MAGIVRATLQMDIGRNSIQPDVCPAEESADLPLDQRSLLRCWNHNEQWGTDFCPYLLYVARSHRTTSRYADPMAAVDEKRTAGKVVGRVACMCTRAGRGRIPAGA